MESSQATERPAKCAPSSTTSVEPAAKRPKHEETGLLKDVPADEFANLVDLYRGPEVTIIVEDKKCQLPRGQLCHNSPIFAAAFEGGFKESIEQRMELHTTTDAFEYLIKWVFTGHLDLLSGRKQTLNLFLPTVVEFEFLKLAHFLMMVRFFTQPLEDAKAALIEHRDSMTDENVCNALELPVDDDLRVMVIKACVKPYIESIQVNQSARTTFKHCELLGVEGFAPCFLKYFDEALQTHARSARNSSNRLVKILSPSYGSHFDARFRMMGLWIRSKHIRCFAVDYTSKGLEDSA